MRKEYRKCSPYEALPAKARLIADAVTLVLWGLDAMAKRKSGAVGVYELLIGTNNMKASNKYSDIR